jgi:hypothetical protein
MRFIAYQLIAVHRSLLTHTLLFLVIGQMKIGTRPSGRPRSTRMSFDAQNVCLLYTSNWIFLPQDPSDLAALADVICFWREQLLTRVGSVGLLLNLERLEACGTEWRAKC